MLLSYELPRKSHDYRATFRMKTTQSFLIYGNGEPMMG
jgi:hypothetical protein